MNSFSDPMLGPFQGGKRSSRKKQPTWLPPTMYKVQVANIQTSASLVAADKQNIRGWQAQAGLGMRENTQSLAMHELVLARQTDHTDLGNAHAGFGRQTGDSIIGAGIRQNTRVMKMQRATFPKCSAGLQSAHYYLI